MLTCVENAGSAGAERAPLVRCLRCALPNRRTAAITLHRPVHAPNQWCSTQIADVDTLS